MPVSAQATAYDLTGSDQARPVVLIHGLGLTRQSTWSAIAPVLARDFRVLTYDLLGHGETPPPKGAVSLTALGAQLIALMDEIGLIKAALVGFSLGGMINRRVALDHPGRVSALAILNSPHKRDPQQQELVEARALGTGAGGPAAQIDETLKRWFTSDFMQSQPDVIEHIKQVVLANDPANYAAHRWVLAHGVKELICPQPPLSTPALVMTCQDDSGSTPAMSHAIAGEIAGSQTQIVPDLRHMGLVERPDLFAEPIARFLRQT